MLIYNGTDLFFMYHVGGLNSDMFSVDGKPEFLRSARVGVCVQNGGVPEPGSVVSGRLIDQSVLVSLKNSVFVSTCRAASRDQCAEMLCRSESEFDGSVFFDGCADSFVREAPVWLYKHCMASRAMAQFYLAVRTMKIPWRFDLNSDAPVAIDCEAINARKIGSQRAVVRTPFELGQGNVLCGIDVVHAVDFIRRFDGLVDLARYVLFYFC